VGRLVDTLLFAAERSPFLADLIPAGPPRPRPRFLRRRATSHLRRPTTEWRGGHAERSEAARERKAARCAAGFGPAAAARLLAGKRLKPRPACAVVELGEHPCVELSGTRSSVAEALQAVCEPEVAGVQLASAAAWKPPAALDGRAWCATARLRLFACGQFPSGLLGAGDVDVLAACSAASRARVWAPSSAVAQQLRLAAEHAGATFEGLSGCRRVALAGPPADVVSAIETACACLQRQPDSIAVSTQSTPSLLLVTLAFVPPAPRQRPVAPSAAAAAAATASPVSLPSCATASTAAVRQLRAAGALLMPAGLASRAARSRLDAGADGDVALGAGSQHGRAGDASHEDASQTAEQWARKAALERWGVAPESHGLAELRAEVFLWSALRLGLSGIAGGCGGGADDGWLALAAASLGGAAGLATVVPVLVRVQGRSLPCLGPAGHTQHSRRRPRGALLFATGGRGASPIGFCDAAERGSDTCTGRVCVAGACVLLAGLDGSPRKLRGMGLALGPDAGAAARVEIQLDVLRVERAAIVGQLAADRRACLAASATARASCA